uniref:Uncharacterized protein n=1 Tax=Panagrolaimus superbus TaxID=310955 RepID=A0A914Y8I4_9BILA
MTFDDFFATWSRRVSQCSGCENHKITTVRLQDPHNTTLHYIRINIDIGANRVPLNVTGFSEVTMFNIQWRLIAAVEFVPGHFKTWVNVNLEWKIIDDSVINDAKRLKTNILCYRMLLYQRIE